MKKRLILLFIVMCLVTSACASGIIVADPIVPTDTKQPEFSATNTVQVNTNTPTVLIETATPTQEPIVDTSTPTILSTETLVPTPTEILPVEWDIDPYIIKEIEGVYRGVTIKGRFIVDRSLEDIVESVEINDNVFAEMIAKMLAMVWYAREKSEPYKLVKPPELNNWVDMWAKAQETGSEYYWKQVQLNSIWANDLNDGDGYVEKLYSFWPMYEGISPYGVIALDKITFVIFDVNKSDILNFDTFSSSTKSRIVGGSNIDSQDLYIYLGRDMKASVESILDWGKYEYTQKTATQYALQLNLASLPDYLIYNDEDSKLEQAMGVSASLWGFIKVAVKYEMKEE